MLNKCLYLQRGILIDKSLPGEHSFVVEMISERKDSSHAEGVISHEANCNQGFYTDTLFDFNLRVFFIH